MTTRAKSIPELPSTAAPTSDDLLVIVDSGTAKNCTVGALLNNSNSHITLSNNAVLTANTVVIKNKMSPANGTSTTVAGGTFFFDENYLYIAVSNNIVKRVSLSSF